MSEAFIEHPSGGVLAAVVDEADSETRGRVVLAPALGMTTHELYMPTHVLNRNGFKVVRFDPRHHVGRSSGEMSEFRLSSLAEDLRVIIEWAKPDLLVAFSLAARAALRVISDGTVAHAVLVTPVVDVASSTVAVTGVDYFDMPLARMPESVELLGLSMSREFVSDAREHGYDDLGGSKADGSAVRSSLSLVTGAHDPWVSHDDVRLVAESAAGAGVPTALVTVPAATHELYRHPVLAMRYFKAMTGACLRTLSGVSTAAGVSIPTLADVIQSVAVMRSRSKAPV
jgi:alpha-beta hydrolase superfamily lysophospholipase